LSELYFPVVILYILNALIRAHNTGKSAAWLLLTNMLVAILVGLMVDNILQPGHGAELPPTDRKVTQEPNGLPQ